MYSKVIDTTKYINDTLHVDAIAQPFDKANLNKLPLFITQVYKLYKLDLFKYNLILIELNNEDEFSILQLEKHMQLIRKTFDNKIVLLLENIQSYNRKRLIEKGINFIVPGKQLYLPELLIDLRENYTHPNTRQKGESLLPSAQFLLIYHIIHRFEKWQLEKLPFKEIAYKLNYTPMAITNAVENLKQHELIQVYGDKEKFIKFNLDRSELWHMAEQNQLLINPVLKTIYTNNPPKHFMLYSNISALPEYSNINPSRQRSYAIGKKEYYDRKDTFTDTNEQEGDFAIEIWKYNPETLVNNMPNELPAVDPLSLYLSLKNNQDERIEMALDQIIEKYIW